MIQDIPEKFNNNFLIKPSEDGSVVLIFRGSELMTGRDEKGRGLWLPKAEELTETGRACFDADNAYVFSIGSAEYFMYLGDEDIEAPAGFAYEEVRGIRQTENKDICFAAATGWHLRQWYRDNRFCGRCGQPMGRDTDERAMRCRKCGNVVYPKIAPAVIVGVTNGDKILLTKYADRVYKRYALIAGFTEIGETAEETVAREVMEETGVRVKNIRYYKSQPWGTDQDLLMGFFADLDGDEKITMDESELSTAEWVGRDDVPEKDDGISLTREMMRVFREGKEK